MTNSRPIVTTQFPPPFKCAAAIGASSCPRVRATLAWRCWAPRVAPARAAHHPPIDTPLPPRRRCNSQRTPTEPTMKTVLLLATALTIVLASENATDDGLEDGQTKCPRDMNNDGEVDADEFDICPFFAECAESTNKTFSGCVPKGNHVCYKYSKGGESGVIVDVAMATPSQSCCDGAVCSSRQTCVEVNDPSATFTYDFDEDSNPVSYTVGQVARNGWQNAKGEAFENKPKQCIDKVFDGAPRPLLKHTALVALATAAPARLGSPPPLRRAQSPRAPGRSSRPGARWSSSSSRSSSCSSRTRTGSSPCCCPSSSSSRPSSSRCRRRGSSPCSPRSSPWPRPPRPRSTRASSSSSCSPSSGSTSAA